MKKRIIAIAIIILILGFGLILNELTSKGKIKSNSAIEWNDTITITQEQPTTTQELKATQYNKKNTKKNTKKKKSKKKKATKKQKHSKSECMNFAHNEVINRYGWNETDWNNLVKLWNRESGWNASAVNKKSGACGIPQALPCSKMKSRGSDYKTNCYTQINWGLGYIAYRYGNPSKAWQHSQKKGWY